MRERDTVTFQVQSQWNNIQIRRKQPSDATAAETSKVCESALNTGLVFRFHFHFQSILFQRARALAHTHKHTSRLDLTLFFASSFFTPLCERILIPGHVHINCGISLISFIKLLY